MNRRKFLLGSSSLFCAPAIVKAENIMSIWVPPEKHIYVGDYHFNNIDFSQGFPNLQEAVEHAEDGTFIYVKSDAHITYANCKFPSGWTVLENGERNEG